jgi:hypothetical protein
MIFLLINSFSWAHGIKKYNNEIPSSELDVLWNFHYTKTAVLALKILVINYLTSMKATA